MIYIWFLNHSVHGTLDRAVLKLIVRMLIPDGLQVKVWPSHERLQKGEGSCVRHGLGGIMEIVMKWGGKKMAIRSRVIIDSELFVASEKSRCLACQVMNARDTSFFQLC